MRDLGLGAGKVQQEMASRLCEMVGVEVVAVFASLRGEVDVTGLVAMLPERCWVFPKVVGGEMVFARVEDMAEDLVPGAYGILEPRDGLPEVAVAEVDLFVCPGVAFTADGGRLGRGKGYYDRVLSRAKPEALKWGVCHAAQVVEDVFAKPHDVKMDELWVEGED